MPLLRDLSRRDRQPELMDDPALAESLHRQALRGLERVNRIRVGHPLDPETEVGPLIHQTHFDKVTAYVGIGKADGATLAAHMAHDKKASAGRVPFLLARGIGQTFLAKDVDMADVAAFLDAVKDSPTEEMLNAAMDDVLSQYDANKQWDDAKDVIEELDEASILKAALIALRRGVAGDGK